MKTSPLNIRTPVGFPKYFSFYPWNEGSPLEPLHLYAVSFLWNSSRNPFSGKLWQKYDLSINLAISGLPLVVKNKQTKNLPANTEDVRDEGSVPVLGRSPGGRHCILLQYSCPENLMDRGAWCATVQGHKELDTTEAS